MLVLAVFGGVNDAHNVYGLVFVVVLLSVLGQGTLVPWVARRLGIPMHDQALRPWQLSVGLSEKPHGVHEFSVTADAAADGQTIADLQLQPGDWVSLIVRDGRPLSPEDPTRLAAGDQVFVLADPTRHEPLARLFTSAD
jgi:cell volume regulation protein A